MHISKKGRDLWLDEKKIQQASQLLEYFLPLIYSSEIVFSFKSSFEERRKLIDRALSSLDFEYYAALKDYNQILKQKNWLLRFGRSDRELENWNFLLAERMQILTQKRQALLQEINLTLAKSFWRFSALALPLELVLVSRGSWHEEQHEEQAEEQEASEAAARALEEEPSQLAEFLNHKLPQEKKIGYSLYGSHLDKIYFSLQEKQRKLSVLSEGQYSLAYYCLLREIQKVYQKKASEAGDLSGR